MRVEQLQLHDRQRQPEQVVGDLREPTAGPRNQGGVGAATGSGSSVEGSESQVAVHPFWSDRVKTEVVLQANRPAALSDAEAAEQQLVINASEVFVSPVGQPTVFGPSVQSSTANGNPDSKSALSQKAEARSHGSSASIAGAGPNAEGYPLPETSGKQSPPPGLRAGERQVLTEMKDLMKSMLEQNRSLTEQNAAMSKRLEKLEEERNSMHSATSRAEALEPNHCLGDQTQEGWDDWGHDWQQGWGLTTKESERLPPSVADLDVAVECSTPRNPPSRESRVEVLNTTPQGTPVPPGPPPTGVSEVSGLCPVEPHVHGVGSLGLLFESCGSQSMSAPAMTTQTPTALGHTIAPPIAPPLPPPSVPPLPHLGNPWHEIGNPRDPYAPGDKVWWQVPALEAVRGDQDPASRASDWLEMLRPIMADLSPLSSVWWERVMAEARAWYDRWVVASALDKGCIVPLMSGELSDIRYRRLESRAYAMLQGSVPQTVRDELVASRSMHCVGLLYHVLRTFQPGGLQERTRLLDQLSSPGVASNASDVVSKLRAWNRSLVRAQSMGVSIPDASIMVRGLDVMVEKLLQKHAHINFRCLGARTVLQLDHRPCLAAVQEYAKVLQSEFEMLAVSGVDDSNKKPKINALQNDDSQNPKTKGNPKGTGKGNPKGSGAEGNSESGPKSGAQKCPFYLTTNGCRNGRDCPNAHSFWQAKGQGRCFKCGAENHREEECTRPKGKGKGKGKGKEPGSLGESGNYPNPKTTPKAPNQIQTAQPEKPKVENQAAQPTQPTVGSPVPAKAASCSVPASSVHDQFVADAHRLFTSLHISALHVAGSPSQTWKSRVAGFVESGGFGKRAVGLLDGGATHALRKAESKRELELSTPTSVGLAIGERTMYLTMLGTLVCEEEISPICPLGPLVSRLGCQVNWSDRGISIVHPTRGRLPVVLEGNCPVVSAGLCLELIDELEKQQHQHIGRGLKLKAMAAGTGFGELDAEYECSWGSENRLLEWVRKLSPEGPERILAQAIPARTIGEPSGERVPFNRHVRRAVQKARGVVIHLFSGGTKPREFGNMPHDVYVLNVDLKQSQDLLHELTYQWLATLCRSGKVVAVIGGPPCRTFSVLRERGSEDGGPRPLRAREGHERFGLENLTADEQYQADKHSVLIFRMLVLHHIADEASTDGCMLGLEGPSDLHSCLPLEARSHNSASVFAWPEIQYMVRHGCLLVHFDQGPLGHVRRKPTTILTNSWRLHVCLHGLGGSDLGTGGESGADPSLESRHRSSSSWAKWAPGLCKAIGVAIRDWFSPRLERNSRQDADETVINRLTKDEKYFKAHCESDHVVFRKDCLTCLEAALRGHRHVRQKYLYSNALTLTLDLAGPFKKGEDHCHTKPVRYLLVASLGVPVYKDGRPQLLEPATDHAIPDGFEDEAAGDRLQDHAAEAIIGGDCRSHVLDHERGEADEGNHEANLEPSHDVDFDVPDDGDDDAAGVGSLRPDAAFTRAREDGDARWKAIAAELRAPVKIHNIVFAEPLCTKRGPEVLRAIQKIYSEVRLMNLGVRRIHSDQGREFSNENLETWANSRDIAVTYSPPEDPRSNGRAESQVNLAKNGIRALLRAAPNLPSSAWPHAARQWAAQRFEQSMKLLGGLPRKRPIVPFGTQVTVKQREWLRKRAPFSSKAVSGVAVCPASRINGATIVRLVNHEDGHEHVRFHTASVVYEAVKSPVRFVGEEVVDDADVPPPPPHRIRGKASLHVSFAGLDPEHASEGESDAGALSKAAIRSREHGENQCKIVHDSRGLDSEHASEGESDAGALSKAAMRSREHGETQCQNSHGSHVQSACCHGCSLCESVLRGDMHDNCVTCGMWRDVECVGSGHGQMLSVAESERRACDMLNRGCVDRHELDELLHVSLGGWKASTRKCDREADAAQGWTLGFFQHGSMVGITNETKRRPNLVRLVNRYAKSWGGSGTWTSLRVTSDFSSGLHKDHNEPGSLNFVVPVSRFGRGRLWTADDGLVSPLRETHNLEFKDASEETRVWKRKEIRGRLIGGCDQAVWFDASKLHAVEESEESRRVVVAYTPRCFVKLPLEDRKLLIDLEFPVPEITYIEDPDPQPTSDQPEKGTSTQAEFFTLLDEDSFELNPNADEDHCSNDAGDASNSFACDVEPDGCVERHRMLRLLISEHQRFLDEELSVGCSGAAEVTSHHLRQLHAAVDAEEAAIIRAHAQVESVDTHGCGEVMRVVGARVAMLKSSSQHVDGHDVQGVPLVPDPDESMPPDMARWVEDGRRVAEQVGSGVPEAASAHPLQTQIVSPLEVLRNLDDWKESIGEELSSVFEVNQALKRTTRGEVQRWQAEGKVIEYIPGKVLFSRKAGSGRHKTRVLACGNYCSNAKSKDRDRRQTLYAGGIDTLSLRCQLRHCGLHAGGDPTPKGRGEGEKPLLQRWTAGVADIRTAFLTAPLEQDKRILIIRPPNTLVRAGVVDAEELWIATGAIYGLEESPAAWSKFRDSKIPTLHITHEGLVYGLKQSESEPNVWLMFRRNENGDLCGELAGVLGVYVDDLLCTGPKPLIQSVFAAVQKAWRISAPQYADEGDGIVFCGLEVRHVDGALRLSQTAYIQSLLERYPHVTGVSSTPYAKEPVFVDQTEPPLLERVRLAQKLVGEVLWVSTRSRPDLCYAVSRLGQLLTKQVEYTITAAENLIRYLRATMHYALVYGNKDHAQHEKGHVGDNAMPLAVDRSDDLVELFADASFSPGVERSQTGVVVTWTGAVLGWMSIRQPTISLSTAEAELNATVDAITLGQSVLPLVRELLQGGVACVTYNDNIGCCTLLQQPQGCWRTRHLRIRAKWCLERLEWRDVSIYHIAGKWMLGDLCTKPLVGQRVRELLTWMCVHTEPSASAANGGESACCDSAPRETSSCDPVGHESGSGGAPGSGGACLTSCAQKLRVAVKSLAYAACLQDVWSKRIVVEVDDDLSLTNLIQRVAIIFCVIGVVAYLAWMNGRNSALQARAESDVNREWSLVPGEAENLTDSQSMSPLDPNPFLHNRSVGVVLGSSNLDSNVDARRDCHAKEQETGGRLHAEELATAERFLDDIAVSGPEGAVHTVDAWIRDGSFSPSGGIAQVRVTTVEEAEPISSSI